MIFYAIKDIDRKLFKTRRNELGELGKDTHLFNSRAGAMACLEVMRTDFGMSYCGTVNDITWSLIEQEKNMDRWHIDISWKEFEAMRDSLNLKIVEIRLNEVNRKKEK